MKVSRRGLIAGAVAVPAAAGIANWRWQNGHGTVLLYDAQLSAGRTFAEAGKAWNRAVLPLEGDRIRFAREVFAKRPAIVQGVSRQGDAVLVQDVAEEAGYERVALKVEGNALEWTFAPRLRA